MHTAVRTKVPLKKKARAITKKKSKAAQATGKENTLPTNNTATSPTFPVMAMPSLRQALAKRQQKSSASTDSPRKLLTKKKKKRPTSSEESSPKKETVDVSPTPTKPGRSKHKKQKGGKLKEVIDYSNPESHSNTFGKVQKWLLESPIVSPPNATSQIEHESKVSTIMSKSQSNPEHMAVVQLQQQQRSPSTNKMKSTTALNDKVRLQVVYKPPFKFSLKFSKKDPAVKTKVIGIDRTKRTAVAQATVNGRVTKRNSIDDPARSRRAALLVRSATEEIHKNLVSDLVNEPIYETLNPKVNQPQYQRHKSSTLTSDVLSNYENVPSSSTANLIDLSMTNSSTSPIINTATYRVNKSASGGNIHARNLPIIGTPVLNGKPSRRPSSHKGSQQNLSQTNTSSGGRRSSISNSSSNLTKMGGSSQNLVRSSTTNLTKNRHDGQIKRRASDMNRSSTTNLNKYHRQYSNNHNGSSSNLRRGDSSIDINNVLDDPQASHSSGSNERRTHSRKNSVNMSISSKSNLPRTCSNSNLMANGQHVGSSRRESFNNNIPRASLVNPAASSAVAAGASTSSVNNAGNFFSRHVSMKPTQLLSQHSRRLLDEVNKNRPQTSSCDSSMFKNFEWPKVLSTQRSVPANNDNLGSDMEVLHSDVENLVTDS